MKNDYILDKVESFAKGLADVLFDVEFEIEPIVIEDMSDKDMVKLIIRRMLSTDKLNEAEDFLFKYAESNPDKNILDIATYFYSELSNKSDDILIKANFPREEISTGFHDFKSTFEKNLQNKTD
ncbi:MAG: DUF6483 family protein [Sarcina sp.]